MLLLIAVWFCTAMTTTTHDHAHHSTHVHADFEPSSATLGLTAPSLGIPLTPLRTMGASGVDWEARRRMLGADSYTVTPSKREDGTEDDIMHNSGDATDPTPREFCRGEGRDMLIRGFQSVIYDNTGVYSAQDALPCMVLLSDRVLLDTPLKYLCGCVLIAAACVAAEFCAMRRRILLWRVHRGRVMRRRGGSPAPLGVKARVVVHHIVTSTVRYSAMMVFMTYQLELCLSVVLGFTLGHAFFAGRGLPQVARGEGMREEEKQRRTQAWEERWRTRRGEGNSTLELTEATPLRSACSGGDDAAGATTAPPTTAGGWGGDPVGDGGRGARGGASMMRSNDGPHGYGSSGYSGVYHQHVVEPPAIGSRPPFSLEPVRPQRRGNSGSGTVS